MTGASHTDAGLRLQQMTALNDARLSRLPRPEQLDALLARVRSVLGADTAAVLVLDQHSQQLAVTAAAGLEEEVRRRIRIPVGSGFAGRVAASAQPLIIEDMPPADIASPVLAQAGVRSLVGVPMFAAGDLVGVIHAGSRVPGYFTATDVPLLQVAADRAAWATTTPDPTIDQNAALALQRSLLPSRLPAVTGTDLAARYVPGHRAGVGGDWYDVFPLTGGAVGLVIGDVSGHGLDAAVVMGRLRSALRAYALISDDPATVLTLLDRKIQHFEAGHLATVAYATISADRTTVRLSLAGHPPPILAAPGETATTVVAVTDPPLGMRPASPRRRTSLIGLPLGGILFCYTDGLVERRGEVIDDGIARLTAAVQAEPADDVCTTVMRLFGVEQPADDIAMLAVRRDPPYTDPSTSGINRA